MPLCMIRVEFRINESIKFYVRILVVFNLVFAIFLTTISDVFGFSINNYFMIFLIVANHVDVAG